MARYWYIHLGFNLYWLGRQRIGPARDVIQLTRHRFCGDLDLCLLGGNSAMVNSVPGAFGTTS
jgi:hypothetical protein